MGWFWAAVGAIAAAGLGAAALLDRRARKQGHRLRGSGRMWLDVRENKRDVRAVDHVQSAATGPLSWMSYFRKNSRSGKGEVGDDRRGL
jgi:hypothetical protein